MEYTTSVLSHSAEALNIVINRCSLGGRDRFNDDDSTRIPLVSAGPDYQDPLVMINARLFRALVNAGPNNAQIIGADNGRLRADIDRIISQLFS